jgi:hypothetical protein
LLKRTWRIAGDNNPDRDEARTVKNFQNAAKGYGLLYGLYVVDGQVCNGGFIQLYDNTHGGPVPFAIEGLQAIGLHQAAAVVEESLAFMRHAQPDVLLPQLRQSGAVSQQISEPRPLEVLDDEYYRLTKSDEVCWLDSAVEELIATRPDLFE